MPQEAIKHLTMSMIFSFSNQTHIFHSIQWTRYHVHSMQYKCRVVNRCNGNHLFGKEANRAENSIDWTVETEQFGSAVQIKLLNIRKNFKWNGWQPKIIFFYCNYFGLGIKSTIINSCALASIGSFTFEYRKSFFFHWPLETAWNVSAINICNWIRIKVSKLLSGFHSINTNQSAYIWFDKIVAMRMMQRALENEWSKTVAVNKAVHIAKCE